ncbi:unnamed protein product [Caenorhabditis nigoni]
MAEEKTDDESNGYFLMYLLLVGIPVLILISCIVMSKYYRRKRKETTEPTRFRYIEHLNPENTWQYEFNGNVVVQCEKPNACRRFLRRMVPIPEMGMWVLQDTMQALYGPDFIRKPDFVVPRDVVSIAIPKENFRVDGEYFVNFVPKDGVEGTYTYEMCSQSVQVTWFHYQDSKYIAGICIYMDDWYNPFKIIKDNVVRAFENYSIYRPNPANLKEKSMRKVWCSYRNEWIIVTRNEFGEVDKFAFNGQENQMELVKCADCFYDSSTLPIENSTAKKSSKPLPTLDFSKFLKVEFCEKWNDLVMVGKDSTGKIAHFNWDSEIGKFKTQSCCECNNNSRGRFDRDGGLEDEPPSYEFLELIELTQNHKS